MGLILGWLDGWPDIDGLADGCDVGLVEPMDGWLNGVEDTDRDLLGCKLGTLVASTPLTPDGNSDGNGNLGKAEH